MRKLRMIAALMTTAAMTVSVTACGNRGAAQTTAAAADYSVQETTAADAAKDTPMPAIKSAVANLVNFIIYPLYK